METKLKIRTLAEMGKATGYMECINDVLVHINATTDVDGKVDADYLITVLQNKAILLNLKHTINETN